MSYHHRNVGPLGKRGTLQQNCNLRSQSRLKLLWSQKLLRCQTECSGKYSDIQIYSYYLWYKYLFALYFSYKCIQIFVCITNRVIEGLRLPDDQVIKGYLKNLNQLFQNFPLKCIKNQETFNFKELGRTN